MANLEITNRYINETKNMVLKTMLTCMKNEISNRVDSIASFMQNVNEMTITEWDKELIEMGLIHDLCKSVIVYTDNNDSISNFETSVSIKGNFEFYGTITRNGKQYRFTTECIIASGMIQRRHFRYITKTDLPKIGNVEIAKQVKQELNGMNKIQRMLDFIKGQKSYINKFQNELNELEKRTEQDWIDAINNSEFPLLVGSKEKYNSFDNRRLETMEWNTFEIYMAWINESNQNSIKIEKGRVDNLKKLINSCNNNIEKEQKKIEKAKA